MKDHEMPFFFQKLSSVAELYGKKISETLLELFWDALSGFELKEVVEAMDACVSCPDGGQFFPKPADIVRCIRGDGDCNALEAWRKVDKAIRRVGSYDSVVFDDPLIHVVIDSLGGWVRLCQCDDENYQYRMHDFLRSYLAYLRNSSQYNIPAMRGLTSMGNARAGYELPDPVYVGDEEKCKAVEKMAMEDAYISCSDLIKSAKHHVKRLES